MGKFRSSFVFGVVVLLAPALCRADDSSPAVHSFYVQGKAMVNVKSTKYVLVPGMEFRLPLATPRRQYALATFAAPAASGACEFRVVFDAMSYAYAYFDQSGIVPQTIIVKVPLPQGIQSPGVLKVEWLGTGVNGCSLRAFYSLSAILTID